MHTHSINIQLIAIWGAELKTKTFKLNGDEGFIASLYPTWDMLKIIHKI